MPNDTKKSLLARFGSGMKKAGSAALSAYFNPAGAGSEVGKRFPGTVRGVLGKALKRGPRSFDDPKAKPRPKNKARRSFVKTDV